jgi:hypothetical protein
MRNTRPGDLSSGYFYEECLAKTALVVRVWGGEGLTLRQAQRGASPQPLPYREGVPFRGSESVRPW